MTTASLPYSLFMAAGMTGVLEARGVHVAHLDDEGMVTELWATADPAPFLALLADTLVVA